MPVICIPPEVIVEQGLCYFEQQASLFGAMVGCIDDPCSATAFSFRDHEATTGGGQLPDTLEPNWQPGPSYTTAVLSVPYLSITQVQYGQHDDSTNCMIARLKIDGIVVKTFSGDPDVVVRDALLWPTVLSAGMAHTIEMEFKRCGNVEGAVGLMTFGWPATVTVPCPV